MKITKETLENIARMPWSESAIIKRLMLRVDWSDSDYPDTDLQVALPVREIARLPYSQTILYKRAIFGAGNEFAN